VTPRPTRETVAGARDLELRRLARETQRTTAELLQLYALEGFLARLARSKHRERFVLKGGVLLAVFDVRRPTRDVDLLGLRIPSDIDAVRALVVSVAEESEDDGLAFDADAATVETIREDDAYAGVRVTLQATLATARLSFHVDVNVGDPVWPGVEEVRLPRLLPADPLELRGYPLVMVLAEKLVTAVQRGTANTRWRDFADVLLLARLHPVVGSDLRRALIEVATYRQAPLVPLRDLQEEFTGIGQARWAAWRRRQGLEDRVPEDFGEVLDVVVGLVDPVLLDVALAATWDPARLSWRG
jgi:hypothetical protein